MRSVLLLLAVACGGTSGGTRTAVPAPVEVGESEAAETTPSIESGERRADLLFESLGPADLSDEVPVELLRSVSAPNATLSLMLVATMAGFERAGQACPRREERGDETIVRGGCEHGGKRWSGEARRTIRRDPEGNVASTAIDFRELGAVGNDEKRFLIDGLFTYREEGDTTHFEIDVWVQSEEQAMAIRYGAREQDDVWNGEGSFAFAERGIVHAATREEALVRSTCRTEAMSGTTTLTARGQTLRIHYDGATDCDDPGTVMVERPDGTRSEVSGISCSASGAGGWPALFMLVALGRRSRQSRRRGDGDATVPIRAARSSR